VVLLFYNFEKVVDHATARSGVKGFPLSLRLLFYRRWKVGKCALCFTSGKLRFATFDIARFVFWLYDDVWLLLITV